MSARTELAHLFMTGKVEAPASRRGARLMPALMLNRLEASEDRLARVRELVVIGRG